VIKVSPVGVCRKWLIIKVLKIRLFKTLKYKNLLMSHLRQTPTGETGASAPVQQALMVILYIQDFVEVQDILTFVNAR